MAAVEALRVHEVGMAVGGVQILSRVSLGVAPGERRAVIGPNGAGKTTLFNIVAGLTVATGGQVYLFGEEVSRLPSHERARRGLSKTFQRTHLCFNLTVFDNLMLALLRGRYPLLGACADYRRDRAVLERAGQILEEWGLAEQRRALVASLSYGDQRRLELALGFAGGPRVLLLDEPTAGLSLGERERLVRHIAAMPRSVTLLLVDHDMDVVFSLADRVTVLDSGRLVAEGTPDEVSRNPAVQEIYLGSGVRRDAPVG